jgi:hypothetical protein
MARVARFIDTMRWQRAVLGDEDLLPVMRADLLRRVGRQDKAKKTDLGRFLAQRRRHRSK